MRYEAHTSLLRLSGVSCLFFFFQAEDGIRDGRVTGVQTCALPILVFRDQLPYPDSDLGWGRFTNDVEVHEIPVPVKHHRALLRSEERRVGKECRSRWSLDHEKKKKKKRDVW